MTNLFDKAIAILHARIVKGEYSPPWFHDIEHMTYTNAGYVLWKAAIVGHYDPGYAYQASARRAAVLNTIKAFSKLRACRVALGG